VHEIPAHADEHRREEEEGRALMAAYAEGGAVVAGEEFESCREGKTLSKAVLAAVASSAHSLHSTGPPHIVGMCAG